MNNFLQEKKDETCSEEQVTIVQERIQDEEQYDDTFKEEISDTVQLCNTIEQHH